MLLSEEFIQLLLKFANCLIVNLIIVGCLYYPKARRRDFFFTFLLTSISVFFLMYFMLTMKAKATMGIGIGLFGIFSIMRFRTDTMPVREMTYLFLIISLSVITAVAPTEDEFGNFDWGRILELVITDAIIIIIVALCEKFLKVKTYKYMEYDRVDLATPEHYHEMLDDLRKRTGLDITGVDVGGITFLKDACVLKIYYNPPVQEVANSVAEQYKVRKSQLGEV